MSLKPRKNKRESTGDKYKRSQEVLRTIGKDDFSKLTLPVLERRHQQLTSQRDQIMALGNNPSYVNAQLDLVEIEMGKRRGFKDPKPATYRNVDLPIFLLNGEGEMNRVREIYNKLSIELEGAGLKVSSTGINDSFDKQTKEVSVIVSGSQTDEEALDTETYVYRIVEETFGQPSSVGYPTIVDQGWEFNYFLK